MSYKFLSRKGPVIAFLASVLFILITIIPIFSGVGALDSIPQNQQAFAPEGKIFLTGIYLTAGLLVLSIALAILMSLFNVAMNPKGAIRSLIGIGILVVIFLVFYGMSDARGSGSLVETIEKFQITESISKIISAGIALTAVLGVGSVVIIFLMEVWNFFKNQ